MKINDNDKESDNFYIMCMPLSISESAPTDQNNCVIEDCPSCNNKMWVSEKKRKLRRKNKEYKIRCAFCMLDHFKSTDLSSDDIEVIDLGSIN